MEGLQARLGRIGLIGGGKMGEAIVAGLVKGAGFDPASIEVAEPFEERWEVLSGLYDVRCVPDGTDLADPQTVIMAVKPQVFREVAATLQASPGFRPRLVVSIAAGVTTDVMLEFFDCAVVRVMPNLCLSVSAGMAAVAPAAGTALAEAELVAELFGLMGDAVIIDESLIDVATAVHGSGPAYYALFTEILARLGAQAGLPQDVSEKLARQTAIGTGRYLELTSDSPAELRVAVTSPGGTTEAALQSFEAAGLEQVMREAFEACLRRARELA